MPTGYTHPVADGKITTFAEFAMSCSRAFGALVMMRDEPADATIPDEFKPDDYYVRKVPEAKEKLSALQKMTRSEIVAACKLEADEELQRHRKYRREAEEKIERYREMLAKVNAWEPPTSEHVGLKEFMVQQLEESIRFDSPCLPEPTPNTDPGEWHAEKISKAEKEVAYAKQSLREEEEQQRSRTEWVKALRKSLKA